MEATRTTTIGELVDHLSVFPRDARVLFGDADDNLVFYRTKRRGPDLVQIEFEGVAGSPQSGEERRMETPE